MRGMRLHDTRQPLVPVLTLNLSDIEGEVDWIARGLS